MTDNTAPSAERRTMDAARLDALYDVLLDWRHKGIPASAHGLTITQWLASGPPPPTPTHPAHTFPPAPAHTTPAGHPHTALADDPHAGPDNAPSLNPAGDPHAGPDTAPSLNPVPAPLWGGAGTADPAGDPLPGSDRAHRVGTAPAPPGGSAGPEGDPLSGSDRVHPVGTAPAPPGGRDGSEGDPLGGSDRAHPVGRAAPPPGAGGGAGGDRLANPDRARSPGRAAALSGVGPTGEALAGLDREPSGGRAAAPPGGGVGLGEARRLATGPLAAELSTPVITLSAQALEHNLRAMAAWCAERDLALAPHGKATMAPQLWHRQLEAGAAAITVATPFQAGVARHFGVPRILIANQIADPAALARLSVWAENGTHIGLFSDSEPTIDRFSAAALTTFDVIVELGTPGGRAGARGVEAALAVAARVAAAPNLRLAGVAGYEGSVASGTDAASLAAVDDYLGDLATLFSALDFETDRPVITAGGSAYFDRVAAILGPLAGEAEVLLRSGSYLVHDHGFYACMTPAARGGDGPEFRPALEGRAQVLSRPEPGLAILDGGRRDFPYDQDLPIPLDLKGARCSQISDQHLFLTGAPEDLRVGDIVRLGLSHPCTSFDKWRLIPVVDETTGRVVDAIHTFF